ncbi:hypothetical protein [Methylobacterium fujisawaense]|uniref:hypothetical protein n=1 Tax=Methylobacterium fujisawaense TaxID=107400 RepID=UPI00313C6DEA
MARLIETAEQHVALQLGNLTAQNIALSCALEQRDRALGDAQARVAELESKAARVADLEDENKHLKRLNSELLQEGFDSFKKAALLKAGATLDAAEATSIHSSEESPSDVFTVPGLTSNGETAPDRAEGGIA